MNTTTLGAHVSVAGGFQKAFERSRRVGADALQIFVKSPNQWSGRDLPDAEVAAFIRARQDAGNPPLVAHAAYLINLASPDDTIRQRSIDGLVDELGRCHELGVDALVVHPGSHVGTGVTAGISNIARSLRIAFERTHGETPLLLESTAGQGTQDLLVVGWS